MIGLNVSGVVWLEPGTAACNGDSFKKRLFEKTPRISLGYIYLINQARGPYWENIGPRS